MPQRLVEKYAPGDKVEITLGDGVWRSGEIARHAHPGVWVKLTDGSMWFVTNGSRIRQQDSQTRKGAG
jgi:hypothetical protein